LAVSPGLTVNRLADDILKQIGSALPDEAERGRVSSAGNREPFRLITPIRAGGSKPPLICFHPIGGGVRVYETLTDALDVSIPVFGVQSRMLAGEDEFSSLAAMAAAYTAAVQVFAPAGPCCLFGYSLGGFLAASVAQRLEAAGRSVEFVGVADGPDCTEQVTTDARHRFARLIASSYQEAAADLPFLKPLDDLDADWTSVRQLAERMLEHREDGAEMFLAWLTDHGRLSGNVAHQTIRAYLQRLAQHLLLIGSSLEAPVIRGSLFVWQATHGLGVGTEVWRRADNLPVSAVLVEADHATLMKPPAVGVIAQQINSAYKAQSSGITVLPGRQ
jgi:thioesterase domain-containing protein